MKKLKFVLLLLLISSASYYAGTKTFSIDFELSETAINRALVSQFNDPNFAFKEFTGTVNIPGYGNASYLIQLTRPKIVIGTNSIGIQLEFDFSVTGTSAYNFNFEATPSLTITDASITSNQVITYLENFAGVINSVSEIPDWLKTLTISLYETYEPWVYASEFVNDVLEEVNSDDFIRQRAFEITDFGVSTSFINGKFVLSVNVEITYGNVEISLYDQTSSGRVLIYPTIDCVLKRMIVRTVSPSDEVYRNESINFECTRNTANQFNLGEQLAYVNHTFWILLETETTFYVREYSPGLSGYGSAIKKIND